MIGILRSAFGIVDRWTRRRILGSALLSLLLALLEMTAFALLYVLITLFGSEDATSGSYSRLRLLLGAQDDASFTARVAVATVTLLLVKSAAAVAVARYNAQVQSVTEARLANRLYGEYVAQDYLTHVARNSAELVRNLTASVGAVCSTVIGSFVTVLTDGTVLLGVFVTLVVVDPVVAASIAAYLLVIVAGYLWVISPVIQRASALDNLLYTETLQTMQEGFAGIKAVQVFDVADRFAARYAGQRDRLARARRVTVFVTRLPPYYLEACVVLGMGAGGFFLVQTRSPDQAFALLGLMVAAALRVLPGVNRVLQSVNAIRSAGPSVDNLLRERPPALAPDGGMTSTPLPPMASGLRLNSVSFTYPGSKDAALDGIDLRIAVGEAVGLVGPSGSGKTTLVDLVLGLLRPDTGAVLVDDVPLSAENVASWRRQVGYVPQDTYLMDATILENVVFERAVPGVPADVEEAVWSALDRAQLAQFVRALPEGLATPVGERGARLSGGQRQRLGIARAMLLQPSVLILDEATSALDGVTEAAFAETIADLQGQVTLVVIAHRLSTVRSCDRILLVRDGRVQADGSFGELYENDDDFRALVHQADVVGRA